MSELDEYSERLNRDTSYWDLKNNWGDAILDFEGSVGVDGLPADKARIFVQTFAAQGVKAGCSDTQMLEAFSFARLRALGDVFVLAWADADKALRLERQVDARNYTHLRQQQNN